jgi:hypothetical protein
VSIAYLSERLRREVHDVQFADAKPSWELWKNQEANKKPLELLLRRYGEGLELRDLTFEHLADVLIKTDERVLREAFAAVEQQAIDNAYPLFFWIVDGTQAVFALASYVNPSAEYGFVTKDPKLIAALRDMKAGVTRKMTPTKPGRMIP